MMGRQHVHREPQTQPGLCAEKVSRYDLPRSGEPPIYAAVSGRLSAYEDNLRWNASLKFCSSGSATAPTRSTSGDGSRRTPASTRPVEPAFSPTINARPAANSITGRTRRLSALALILLLDQFPRNIFRGTPRAFATDSKALATAKDVVARGFDLALPPVRRSFIYLPFQHSENLDDQQESVRLFRKLAAEHPATAGYVEYAEHHMDVIRRFGRFPHRNAVLGRASTSEETEFLQRPT